MAGKCPKSGSSHVQKCQAVECQNGVYSILTPQIAVSLCVDTPACKHINVALGSMGWPVKVAFWRLIFNRIAFPAGNGAELTVFKIQRCAGLPLISVFGRATVQR